MFTSPPSGLARNGHVASDRPFRGPSHTVHIADKDKKSCYIQQDFHRGGLCTSTFLVGRFAVNLVRLLVHERAGHVARDLGLHGPSRAHGVFVQDAG